MRDHPQGVPMDGWSPESTLAAPTSMPLAYDGAPAHARDSPPTAELTIREVVACHGTLCSRWASREGPARPVPRPSRGAYAHRLPVPPAAGMPRRWGPAACSSIPARQRLPMCSARWVRWMPVSNWADAAMRTQVG